VCRINKKDMNGKRGLFCGEPGGEGRVKGGVGIIKHFRFTYRNRMLRPLTS
jgi:hypothetical protein